MKAEELHKLFLNSTGITTDSRKIIEGCIFFALKGERFNGNKYASEAISNGAMYAIIDEEEYKKSDSCILVDNVLECLQQLSHYHRKQSEAKVIAITGSNGKTTTKELINIVLKQKYKTIATEGNLNNHIGVPLTLLNIKDETEVAVVEMGANHTGEIKMLSEIADPDYGIITNIGKAHIEGFGSFKNVIKAKKELYDYLENKDGKIFINLDNEILTKNCKCHKISYAMSNTADYTAEFVKTNPFLILNWKGEKEHLIKTNLLGEYNLENILAAITIGSYFNVSDNKIVEAVENYKPDNNRSQIRNTDKDNLLYMDFYNANPSSMNLAIESFSKIKNDKPNVFILGDMLELGNVAEQEHLRIIQKLKILNADKVFLVGNIFDKVNSEQSFKTYNDSKELANYLKEHNINISNILIKGSRGIKLDVVIDLL